MSSSVCVRASQYEFGVFVADGKIVCYGRAERERERMCLLYILIWMRVITA